jgi:hypothetical protein
MAKRKKETGADYVAVLQEQVFNSMKALKIFKELKGLTAFPDDSRIIAEPKSLLNRTYLLILLNQGSDSVIVDPPDRELMNAVRTYKTY